jgi:hypothetical protein
MCIAIWDRLLGVLGFWQVPKDTGVLIFHDLFTPHCLSLSTNPANFEYYGIRGHFKMLDVKFELTERAWPYWLSTRSHTGHMHWQKFEDCLRQHLPLPTPKTLHDISQGEGQHSETPHGVSPVWLATGASSRRRRHRMRSLRSSGSVGRVPRNRCLYPEADGIQPALLRRCGFQAHLTRGVTQRHEEAVYWLC